MYFFLQTKSPRFLLLGVYQWNSLFNENLSTNYLRQCITDACVGIDRNALCSLQFSSTLWIMRDRNVILSILCNVNKPFITCIRLCF